MFTRVQNLLDHLVSSRGNIMALEFTNRQLFSHQGRGPARRDDLLCLFSGVRLFAGDGGPHQEAPAAQGQAVFLSAVRCEVNRSLLSFIFRFDDRRF